MRKSIKRIAATMLATVTALTVVANVSSVAEAAPKFDPASTYQAHVGFQQTGTWIFHDECTSETLGLEGSDIKEAGLNYATDVLQSFEGLSKVNGTAQGAEIKGNGTYTISIKDLNGALTAKTGDDVKMAMIYISTNIPADAEGTIKFSDVTLKLDGKTQTLPGDDKLFVKPETKALGYYSLYLVDTYAKDQGEYKDSPEPMSPNDSIEITFTVSGMAQDDPDAVPPTPTPAPKAAASTDSADDAKDDSGFPVVPVACGVVGVVAVVAIVVVVAKKKK